MSSAESNEDCSICDLDLGSDRTTVTTECGHIFHRDCAQERLDKKKKGDCKTCRKKLAITNALMAKPASSKTTQSNATSVDPVSNEERSVAAEKYESADEQNDWECPSCSNENTKSDNRCSSCSKLRHLASTNSKKIAVRSSPQVIDKQNLKENEEQIEDHDEVRGAESSSAKSSTGDKQQQAHTRSLLRKSSDTDRQDREEQSDSYRAHDDVGNRSGTPSEEHNASSKNALLSKHVHQSGVPAEPQLPYSIPSCDRSMSAVPGVYPDLKSLSRSTSQDASGSSTLPKSGYSFMSPDQQSAFLALTKSFDMPPSSGGAISLKDPKASASQTRAIVYIAGLPIVNSNNIQLETQIRLCLENIIKINSNDIKVYTNLGVGFIRVDNDEIKNKLINDSIHLTLNINGETITISFAEELTLTSYIVLDIDREKKDTVLPTPDEMSRYCVHLYNGRKPRVCEVLAAQFPNIYKIVLTSPDDLLTMTQHLRFAIHGLAARIYYCADCSFFEDLPRLMTTDKLRQAIERAIHQPHTPLPSIDVQLNKETNNACVIVMDATRLWSTMPSLDVDGKQLHKQTSLISRLRIYPIRQPSDIQRIINHMQLAGKIVRVQQQGDGLILELNDQRVFDQHVASMILKVDDQTHFHVEPYSAASKPEAYEIDEKTWYETKMPKYKADIMEFVVQPNHEIFFYRWNPEIWLKQFQLTLVHNQNGGNVRDRRNTPSNQTRHQLRVTVMLNTLAVVRKKSYIVENEEVKMNIDDQMKTIVYDHRSKLERGGTLPFTKTPYESTRVHVVPKDCLLVCEKLIKNGHKPLLLNMANAKTPGGGYRKGDGAQEENLFRRSDYFRSLDERLDQWLSKRTDRFHCSSDGRLDRLSDHNGMYPMDEYGAIYTSGLTVFRQSEDAGYAFLKKPLEGVCAVAMAAYRDPKLEGNMLSSTYAVGTRKKIENIFAIAVRHKHDCLVLSAFGCGAFRNPPVHIAQIFSSVIHQYAGFFKRIAFAIIDDHNTGQQLNPEGNFKPFKDVLDGMEAIPLAPHNRPHTMFGPYRLLSNDVSAGDVCIFDKTPCRYGAHCRDIYIRQHAQEYSHPLRCPYQIVQDQCDFMKDSVHMQSFIHKIHCQYGGECREINEGKHSREYEHPSYCSRGSACDDMDAKHLKEHRHLPLCPKGKKCTDYRDGTQSHCKVCRHCAPTCLNGNHCANIHDEEHHDTFRHPFPRPCSFTPFHCRYYTELTDTSADRQPCSLDAQKHCLKSAHVCRLGRNCTDNDVVHRENSIHIARKICPDGDQCEKLDHEDHLNSFTHPDIPDVRELCKQGDQCYHRRELGHIKKYRHAAKVELDGIWSYFDSNKGIDFVRNLKKSIERVTTYVQDKGWKPLPSGRVPYDIINWLRTVQPVYRCNPVIFESILLHGHVMSRDYMENLRKAKFVANSVLQHSRIQQIPHIQEPKISERVSAFILALVTARFEKKGFSPASDATENLSDSRAARADSAYDKDDIQKYEEDLSGILNTNDLDAIRKKAKDIADASINLHKSPLDMDFAKNKELGMNKTVCSILGPHLGHYYGDIVIVFKRTILHHPDASFSIQAANSFVSGDAFRMRPWLGDDPGSPSERMKLFHGSKLNASIPGYEDAAALELIALTSHYLKLNSMDISLEEILERWMNVDAHDNIQGHLPPLIPMSYIDHIYIPRNLHDRLSVASIKSIKTNFKFQITIVPEDGEADQPHEPIGPTPSSKSRANYQQIVSKNLVRTCREYMKHPPSRPAQGAAITIGPVDFRDHYILPLTISRAYDQYRFGKAHQPSNQTIYIYWQTSTGDMMLTLSNKPIGSGEKQTDRRYLTCYIASFPTHITDAETNWSYLDDSPPHQHHRLMKSGQFAAKSDTFFVGCNSDDFMTFCLEIQPSTGLTTLTHAGPNAIYNHEKISHEFQRTELDLGELNLIHVSSGSLTVPVRDLMICFEKQVDLHPTFDTHFKVPSNNPPQPRKRDHSDDNRKAEADDAKKPGFLGRVKNFLLGNDPSKLIPCSNNVNCPIQYSSRFAQEHNAKYSHPCRFSELCHNKESHLTHEPHQVPTCKNDRGCTGINNPSHRAQFRHTGLPDFLIPCRYMFTCRDKTDPHRIKYSHGEKVYRPHQPAEEDARANPSPHHQHEQRPPRSQDPNPENVAPLDEIGRRRKYPCKYGTNCHDHSAQHLEKYSHPTNDEPNKPIKGQRQLCEHGKQCRLIGEATHREKYFHSDPSH